jgi:hypothetical protein
MTADLVVFVVGAVVGAFFAGVVFGGQYVGLVVAASRRRSGDQS